MFGPPRPPGLHFFTAATGYPSYFGAKSPDHEQLAERNQHYADIAASVQRVTEEVLLHMARALHQATGQERLCMAGGVALNSVANSRIPAGMTRTERIVEAAGRHALPPRPDANETVRSQGAEADRRRIGGRVGQAGRALRTDDRTDVS